MDQWENDLANDLFSVEEVEADNANGSVLNASHANNASGSGEDTGHASNASGSGDDTSHAIIASNKNGSAAINQTINQFDSH